MIILKLIILEEISRHNVITINTDLNPFLYFQIFDLARNIKHRGKCIRLFLSNNSINQVIKCYSNHFYSLSQVQFEIESLF